MVVRRTVKRHVAACGQLFVLLGVAMACGMDARREGERLASPPRRTILAENWDTLWIVGGGEADTLLLDPLRVVAGRGRVYVLDQSGPRVISFAAADGTLLWMAGTQGGGPGEFLAPRAMALLPDGRVVVSDIANARLTILGGDGASLGSVLVHGVGDVLSLCALQDGSVLLFPGNSTHHLVRMSIDGRVFGPIRLPWPDLEHAPPLARQVELQNDPTGEACIAALNMGRGYARFEDGRFRATGEYIEHVELPVVEERESHDDEGRVVRRVERIRSGTLATRAVSLRQDTLAVVFSGTTRRRGRLIDLYVSTSGEYIGSLVYDRSIRAIGYDAGVFFLLHETAGYPTLVAVVPTRR